jgi:serine/threonine-protein phosphatase 2A regulatory subunit B''
MKLHSQEPVSFDDIKNEIFDMIKPEDPLKVTPSDLIRWYACILLG